MKITAEWPKHDLWIIERADVPDFLKLTGLRGLTIVNAVAGVGEMLPIGCTDYPTVGETQIGVEIVYEKGQNEAFWDFTHDWTQLKMPSKVEEVA